MNSPKLALGLAVAGRSVAALQLADGCGKQLSYFVAHPEKVTPDDIAAAEAPLVIP